MSLKFKTPKCWKRFMVNQKGSAAVFTAMAIVPLLLAAGTAIDFARVGAAQTSVQSALDAAALAGASLKGKTDAERIAAAQKSFTINSQNSSAGKLLPTADFKVVDDKIVATAKVEVPTALMHLAGIESVTGNSRAEVNILADKKAEIVLVLDYSGSMGRTLGGKVKYKVMRDAATKLINDLSKSDPDSVKFGIVPFSNHVYTTLPGSFVLGGSGTWTGCTQDRRYPHNISDATPTSDKATQWNQPLYASEKDHPDAEQLDYDCAGFVSNNLKTVDLTKNFKSLTGQLKSMGPFGYTHIALGVEFGYHMLSPNAPFTQGVAYNDKNTKKFMVVLTDGEQTTGGFGPSSRTVTDGENNLVKLCESAKANKITMMTMAFDLDDAPTVQRLKNCSSEPSRDFFAANDAKSLEAAFESIKDAVSANIFLSQ